METMMNMPVHYAIGEYYYRGRPALGAAGTGAWQFLDKATEPRMIGLYAAGIAAGGVLMAISEFSGAPKGHHGTAGRLGRGLLGVSAAIAGALTATVMWQNQALI